MKHSPLGLGGLPPSLAWPATLRFPYELSDKTERHYQVVFYLVFTLMGQYIQAEVRSAKGRADAVVWTADRIFVFEFKLQGTAEEALAQIDARGYGVPYEADGREVVKVGVEFDRGERDLGRWLVAAGVGEALAASCAGSGARR